MSAAVAEIVESINQAKASATRRFYAIARTIAIEGKKPKPAEALEILTQSGKSIADLEAEIARLEKRKAAAAAMAASDEAQKRVPELEKKIGEARAALEEAEAQYELATSPLFVELGQIRELGRPYQENKQTLWETADPQAKAAEAVARQEVSAIEQQIGEYQTAIAQYELAKRKMGNRAFEDIREAEWNDYGSRSEILKGEMEALAFKVNIATTEVPRLEKLLVGAKAAHAAALARIYEV